MRKISWNVNRPPQHDVSLTWPDTQWESFVSMLSALWNLEFKTRKGCKIKVWRIQSHSSHIINETEGMGVLKSYLKDWYLTRSHVKSSMSLSCTSQTMKTGNFDSSQKSFWDCFPSCTRQKFKYCVPTLNMFDFIVTPKYENVAGSSEDSLTRKAVLQLWKVNNSKYIV